MVKKTPEKTIRILHVAFTLHDPMINQWLLRFLKKTKSKHIQIDLMTTADEAAIFQNVIHDIGGRILVCPHPKNKGAFLRFFRDSITSDKDSKQPAYDVLHVHPFIMAGEILMQAFRANIATRVIHAHADRRKTRREKSFFSKIKNKISKTLIQRLATHGVSPDKATATNIFGKNWHMDSRWQIMPYGQAIVLGLKKECEDIKAKVKEALMLPQRSTVISQISAFNFEKNHDLTLRLFEKEARRNLSLYLILAGQGPLREKIERYVLANGLDDRVIFLDMMADHKDILSITNLLMMPSLYETDISVLVKAQLCAVPCLISNEISQSEYLKNDLIHSLPVDSELDIWSRAARSILSETAVSYDKQVESLKGSPYDIDVNAEKFLGLYQQRHEKN